jgi:hypothetical protein
MAQSNTDKFLGFDVATYPGDAAVGWLWIHGFRVAGFYLNHHRGGEDDTWISRRSKLVSSGWGLAPLYLGWQTVDNRGNHLPPPSDPSGTASIDAAEAAKLMNKAGFDPGSVVYFDLEDGSLPMGNYDEYLSAWFDRVRMQNFMPAVYCSHHLISWASDKRVPCWSFNIPFKNGGPYDPGDLPVALDPGCLGTQFRQEVHLNGLPLRLDLDCFVVPDPSSASATAQIA